MSYEKIGWQPGSAPFINANNLDHMDQGIKDNALRSLANADKIQYVDTVFLPTGWQASSDFSNYPYHYDVIDDKFDGTAKTIDVYYDDGDDNKEAIIDDTGIRENGVHDSLTKRVRIYAEAIPTGDIGVRFEVKK